MTQRVLSYEMDRKLEQENGILSFDKIYEPAVHFSLKEIVTLKTE